MITGISFNSVCKIWFLHLKLRRTWFFDAASHPAYFSCHKTNRVLLWNTYSERAMLFHFPPLANQEPVFKYHLKCDKSPLSPTKSSLSTFFLFENITLEERTVLNLERFLSHFNVKKSANQVIWCLEKNKSQFAFKSFYNKKVQIKHFKHI